jgi:hypothetical protein
LAEESVPPLLSSGTKYDALVVALHLGTQASRARIVGPMPISAPPDAVPEALRGNPCAAAWTLAHRIETAQYGRIAIASEPQPWCVDLDPTS